MHTDQTHTIVIIGAGVAGLAAGAKLQAAGRSPLLLEARERIGGRIYSDHTHAPVELGAEFIHGEHAVTWRIIRTAGLAAEAWLGERRFARGGALIATDTPWTADVEPLYDRLTSYAGPDRSAADLLNELSAPEHPARGYAARLLANIEGADLKRLSAREVSREHMEATNGPTNFHVLSGYDQVPAALAAGLDIRLNAPVAEVAWDSRGCVLSLRSGETIRARQVIVTVPLPILRDGHLRFSPALPEERYAAMRRIEMGNVTKLALWFSRRFWNDFRILNTDGAIPSWWPSGNAEYPALIGFVGGPAALDLGRLGEAGAIECALGELEALFGSAPRREFRFGRLVDWARDPWSLGAYTYTPVGGGGARAIIAAPLDGTLFFAGEATCTNGHLATVHGAIESGERAADEALADM
jgi:monoamine oxidase